jgi:alkylresorcinol/alkylpyrone synthase
MPRLVAVATALPTHRVDQQNAKRFVASLFAGAFGGDLERLIEVFDHTGIESRRVCMPLEWYGRPHTFGEANDLYVTHALELAQAAALGALERAGLSPGDVDHVVLVSSSGVATPSLDARLANRIGFREDVRRTPIWGLGCAGGAVGLSRARDFALADPSACVLLVAVELCSLTFQHGDADRRNLVAASLFSDGAAAAVVCGVDRPGSNGAAATRLELIGSRSTIWRDTLDVMGWTIDERGLHVVFSRDIPTIVRRFVRPNLESFLADHGLGLSTLDHVVAHPGGPKVLAAYAETLALPAAAFRHAGAVLRDAGNMSSPTCLFVLERALAASDFAAGEHVVIAALGPGFSSEYVLARVVT